MYSDYSSYILNIRNNLIQCGIDVSNTKVSIERNIDEDYYDLFVLSLNLEDILYFYRILGISGSKYALKGFFLPLNESYKDRVRKLAYEEYESDVLPKYVKLSGKELNPIDGILNFSESINLPDDKETFSKRDDNDLSLEALLEDEDFFNSMFSDIDVVADVVDSSAASNSDVIVEDVVKVEKGILLHRGNIKAPNGIFLSRNSNSQENIEEFGYLDDEDNYTDESDYVDEESEYEDKYSEDSEYEDEESEYTDDEDDYIEESEYTDDEDEELTDDVEDYFEESEYIDESEYFDDDDYIEESEYIDDEEDLDESEYFDESEHSDDEDEELEESEYTDDEDEELEESEYTDDEDDYIEESEYTDDEDDYIEESEYTDDEDDYIEESEYTDDEDEYLEKSIHASKNNSLVSKEGKEQGIVEDTDLCDVIQNVTNNILTTVKRKATGFIYRKE